jgi:hypothetical protein
MTKDNFKKIVEEREPITLELTRFDFEKMNNKKYNYWRQYLEILIGEINGDNYGDLDLNDINDYMESGAIEIKFDAETETTTLECGWVNSNLYKQWQKDIFKDLDDCVVSLENHIITKKWDEVEEDEFEYWWNLIYRYYSTRNKY